MCDRVPRGDGHSGAVGTVRSVTKIDGGINCQTLLAAGLIVSVKDTLYRTQHEKKCYRENRVEWPRNLQALTRIMFDRFSYSCAKNRITARGWYSKRTVSTGPPAQCYSFLTSPFILLPQGALPSGKHLRSIREVPDD